MDICINYCVAMMIFTWLDDGKIEGKFKIMEWLNECPYQWARQIIIQLWPVIFSIWMFYAFKNSFKLEK